MGLLGLPPLLGFLGKVPLFTSAISAGEIPLVIVLGSTPRLRTMPRSAYVAFIDSPEEGAAQLRASPFPRPASAGAISLGCVIGLAIAGWKLGQMGGGRGAVRGRGRGAGPGVDAVGGGSFYRWCGCMRWLDGPCGVTAIAAITGLLMIALV